MSGLLFQEIIKLTSRKGIVLCRSINKSGENFFHYIMTDRRTIKQMHRDYDDKKEVDFALYGEIVHSGWGENPSAEDELLISQKFPK